ncbi:MAG: O-antigen ligase, partial [Planctomycetota bacterium]
MRQESVYGQVAFSACLTGLLALVLLPSFTAPIALVGLALTLTFTGFACDCVATAKDKDVAPKGLLFVWLIAAALLLSLATQTHNWQGVERVTIWVACCCGCITVKNRARGCSRQRQLIQSILLLFVTLALRALAERFYLYSMLRELAGGMGFEAPDAEYAGFFGSARARATFGQANGFAGFLLLLLPLIIAMSSVTLRSKKSWFFVVLSVLCLWASGSKGGTLVYIFIAGVCLLRWSGNLIVKRLARVLLAIAVVGLSACLLSLIDGALPSSLEGLFETFRLRQGYWITALSMIGSEGAIGVGAGLFGESFYLFTDTNTSFSRFAHNGYLGIAAEFGLIGILLVGILVWAWWKSKPVPTEPEPEPEPEPELDGIKRIPIEFIGAFLISAPSFSLNLLAEGGWWTACFTMLPIVLGLHHFIGRDVVTKTVARVDRLKQAAW